MAMVLVVLWAHGRQTKSTKIMADFNPKFAQIVNNKKLVSISQDHVVSKFYIEDCQQVKKMFMQNWIAFVALFAVTVSEPKRPTNSQPN